MLGPEALPSAGRRVLGAWKHLGASRPLPSQQRPRSQGPNARDWVRGSPRHSGVPAALGRGGDKALYKMVQVAKPNTGWGWLWGKGSVGSGSKRSLSSEDSSLEPDLAEMSSDDSSLALGAEASTFGVDSLRARHPAPSLVFARPFYLPS